MYDMEQLTGYERKLANSLTATQVDERFGATALVRFDEQCAHLHADASDVVFSIRKGGRLVAEVVRMIERANPVTATALPPTSIVMESPLALRAYWHTRAEVWARYTCNLRSTPKRSGPRPWPLAGVDLEYDQEPGAGFVAESSHTVSESPQFSEGRPPPSLVVGTSYE